MLPLRGKLILAYLETQILKECGKKNNNNNNNNNNIFTAIVLSTGGCG